MRLRFRIVTALEKLLAMNVSAQFNLLDLPNELISYIIEFVDGAAVLSRLASTCRRVQHLAEPRLYGRILLRDREEAVQLRSSLLSRAELALAVRKLEVPCNAYYTLDMGIIADMLTGVWGLRELLLESPSCNAASTSRFENEEFWDAMADRLSRPFQQAIVTRQPAAAPLQKLTKLTLHLNGPSSPYWTLDDRSLPLFLHPTLQDIHISCMNLYGAVFDNNIIPKAATPLKHLVLEECNISHSGLKSLLSLPKALETLGLGENSHNFLQFGTKVATWCNHLFKTNPGAVLDALAQQKHSLMSLAYVTPGNYYFRHRQIDEHTIPRTAPVDAGFADFCALEMLTLRGTCQSFERAVLSSRPPPNLRELTFQQDLNPLWPLGNQRQDDLDNAVVIPYIPFFRAPSASVPATLEIFNIVCQYSMEQQDIFISEEDRKSTIRRAAKAISETHGVKMHITSHDRGHYFPPFLYGEPRPRENMIYDGAKDRFVEESLPEAGFMAIGERIGRTV